MTTLAYVDPGVGLLAWQALVAFFVGLIFYLKKTRTWITNTVSKVFRPNVVSPTKKPAPAPEGELVSK